MPNGKIEKGPFEKGPEKEIGVETEVEEKKEREKILEACEKKLKEERFAKEMSFKEEEMRDGLITKFAKSKTAQKAIKVLGGLMIITSYYLAGGGCERFKRPQREKKKVVSEQYMEAYNNYWTLVDSLKGDPQEVYNTLLAAETKAAQALKRAKTPADSARIKGDLDSLRSWKNEVALKFDEKVVTKEEKEAARRLEIERRKEAARKERIRKERIRKEKFQKLLSEVERMDLIHDIKKVEDAITILKKAKEMEKLAKTSEDFFNVQWAYWKAGFFNETRDFCNWKREKAYIQAFDRAKRYEDYRRLISPLSKYSPEKARKAALKALDLAKTSEQIVDILTIIEDVEKHPKVAREIGKIIPQSKREAYWKKAKSLVRNFKEAYELLTRRPESEEAENFEKAFSLAKTWENYYFLIYYSRNSLPRLKRVLGKGIPAINSVEGLGYIIRLIETDIPLKEEVRDFLNQARERAKKLTNDSYQRAKRTGRIEDFSRAKRNAEMVGDSTLVREIERIISLQEKLE